MNRPGAVLEITCADEFAEPVVAGWRIQATRLLEAVGWGTEVLAVRRYPGGASLALSAPIDGLLAATEVNEWALEAAGAALNNSPQPSLHEAAQRIQGLIAEEENPRLRAIHEAALAYGVTLLADPELVSVGSGTGSLTWPRDQIPSPADIDWPRVHDVPTILITGSNGKTTTVRLLGAVVTAAGRVAGWSCTDNVTVAGQAISDGDWAGPGGARMVLRDRRVEIAILETARGGILRRGLAVTRADAAIVTNIAEDHFGEWGAYDLPTLAEAKLVVTRAVGPAGRVVLNADDAELVAAAGRVQAPITWISCDPDTPLVRGHLSTGGDACLLEAGELVLRRPGIRETVAQVAEVPITVGGAARHNVYNALGVIGLAAAIGIPTPAIGRGLRNFRGTAEENPGRLNLFELGGVRVVVDFAHNPHGMDALVGLATGFPARRRLLILGQAGDRDDASIREFARSAWRFRPDRIVLKEMEIYRRGRAVGEATALLADEFRRLGAAPESMVHADSELAAVHEALRWARPGDLLLLPTHSEREEVLALLQELRRREWKPGEVVGIE